MNTLPVKKDQGRLPVKKDQGSRMRPVQRAPQRWSARAGLVLGFATLAFLVVAVGGWSTQASIAGAVIAAGKVEPRERAYRVQHVHGGTVRNVLIRNGQRVEAGTVLIQLDDSELRASEKLLAVRLAELTAERNRLEAEAERKDRISWDEGLADDGNEAAKAARQGQVKLFEARRITREGLRAQSRERVIQTKRQVSSLVAQARAVRKQHELLGDELGRYRTMYDKSMATIGEVTAREREVANLEGQIGDIEARVAAARSKVAEIEIEVLQLDARQTEEARGAIRQTQGRENETQERLAGVRERIAGSEVRAPVTGEVFAMQVFGTGEVIRPGDTILSIVPSESELIVRAQVQPTDIDQIWDGQSATIIFPAFAQRTTPAYGGTVTWVGADVVQDSRTGQTWYEVEIEIGESIGAGAEHTEELALVPGMPGEAHIKTGDRSPASYLIRPVTDVLRHALREE